MKRYIRILFGLLLVLVGSAIFFIFFSSSQWKYEQGISYYREGDDFVIFQGNESSLFFVESGSTVKEIQSLSGCKIVVNGSYFGRNEDGSFFPAGVWYDGLDVLHPASEGELLDPNLQVFLKLPQGTGDIQIGDLHDGIVPESGSVIFNAGPLLFFSGEQNNEIMQNISHWQGSHPRTVLVVTAQKELFFVVMMKKVTLEEAGKVLQGISEFGNDFHAINLDGGPSSSISSPLSEDLLFNKDERLPIFFCVR